MHMLNLNNKISIQWMSATFICIVIVICMNWESFSTIDKRKHWNKKEAKETNNSVIEETWVFNNDLMLLPHSEFNSNWTRRVKFPPKKLSNKWFLTFLNPILLPHGLSSS